MNKNNLKNSDFFESNENMETYIDINKYINIIFRNKNFIFLVTLVITSISIISTYFKASTYQGRFEILTSIEKESDLKTNFINPFSQNKNNENIQVILKSRSILLPIFEYTKNYNKQKGKFSELIFEEWKDSSLSIIFKKKTDIVEVRYKDKDKILVMNVLNKIEQKFKEYSISNRLSNINSALNYLETQIIKAKEISKNSLLKLNKFSLENNLGNIDGLISEDQRQLLPNKENLNANVILQGFPGNNRNIDNLNLKNLEGKKINNSGAGQRFDNHFGLLERYEAKYTDLSSKLKTNSKILSNLKIKIENMKEYLKRPSKILLEYRELVRVATRDEQTLRDLEDRFNATQLEKAKKQQTWQVISAPFLDEYRISPKKKEHGIIGLILGFSLSTIFAFIKEKRSKKIYEFSELIEKMPFNYLDTIKLNQENLNSQVVSNVLFKRLKLKQNETINCLYLNSNDAAKEKYKKLLSNLAQLKNKTFIKVKDIDKNNNNILIFISLEKITFPELENIIDLIKDEEKILGWFLIK